MRHRGRHARRSRRGAGAPLAAAVIGAAVLVITGQGVWAALSATATTATPQAVGSGTLRLTLADNGAGFTQGVSNLAPGDVVQRYVDVTNAGTLAGQALTMTVAATGAGVLMADGATTRALRLSVNGCVGGTWSPSGATCSGTVVQHVPPTALGTLAAPVTLVPGTVAAGAGHRLQVVLQLPDQTETTVNGAPPASTVQGQSASLTYTFTESQRTAATSSS